jgi:hypothetical protein
VAYTTAPNLLSKIPDRPVATTGWIDRGTDTHGSSLAVGSNHKWEHQRTKLQLLADDAELDQTPLAARTAAWRMLRKHSEIGDAKIPSLHLYRRCRQSVCVIEDT